MLGFFQRTLTKIVLVLGNTIAKILGGNPEHFQENVQRPQYTEQPIYAEVPASLANPVILVGEQFTPEEWYILSSNPDYYCSN